MPLTLTRTVAPTVEPVTRAEAKAHLRVDVTDEDTLIDTLITTAREHAEALTERQFITATYTLKLDAFNGLYGCIELPRPLLIGVSSITYSDSDDATQTLSSSLYQVDSSSEPARIIPAYGETWPDTRPKMNAVTITFTAGYGATAASVPTPLKQAILLLVAHWFENREPVNIGNIVSPIPFTVSALLGPFRIGSVY